MVSQPVNPPAAPGTPSGPTAVLQGSTSTYTVAAASGATSYSWTATNGALSVSGTGTTGTINWGTSYVGSTYVYCTATNLKGSTQGAVLYVTISAPATPLVPGSLTPTTQAINYNTVPVLNATPATGGNGVYSYQWQSCATINGTYANIASATNAAYTPPALTATTYYQRIDKSNGSTANTNIATVTVYPQLVAGTASPATQTLLYGAIISPMSSVPTGGNGNYTYQWQSSATNNGTDWTNIIGATSATYSPGFSNNTIYYRLNVSSNGVTVNTNTCSVIVTNCSPISTNLTTSMNYIATSTFNEAGISSITDSQITAMGVCDVMQTVDYLDGLGRPIQLVQVKGSPNQKDIVKPIAYDQNGREAIKYLPYTVTGTNPSDGSFKPNAISTDLPAYYNPIAPPSPNIATTYFPYAETKYDGSPMNLVREQGEVGDAWQLTNKTGANSPGHTIKTANLFNNNSTDPVNGRMVEYYQAIINADGSRSLIWNSSTPTYNTNELYVTVLYDQNWVPGQANPKLGTTEEYWNSQGKIIMQRTFNFNTATNLAETLSTYYVYDDYNNLCFILPPKAEADAGGIVQTTLDNLCYQYFYDNRQRLTGKKEPGRGWDFMVYNQLDQLVLTQDANSRNKLPQQWAFTKYDGQGRIVLKGIYNDLGSTADNSTSPSKTRLNLLQTACAQQTTPWETINKANTVTGYTNNAFPVDNSTAAPNNNVAVYSIINYYDDYNVSNLPSQYNFTSSSSVMTMGLPTVTLTNVIGTTNMLWTVNYYDDKGQIVRADVQHYLGGVFNFNNYDEVTNTYNFSGNITVANRNNYTAAGSARNLAVTINNIYYYDHTGREKKTEQQINTDNKIVLVQKDYNEIGQLIGKHLHSADGGNTFMQNTAYAYNERGWLNKINDPTTVSTAKAFGMQLYYGDNPNTSLRTYNGNISSMIWQTQVPASVGTGFKQSFDYTYDNLSRLTLANYTTPGMVGAYNEAVSYDKMDNIITLNRTANSALIDKLQYTYTNNNQSNTLLNIVDNSGSNLGQNNGTTNYTFDLNGNMVKDDSKPITINYNYLNLAQIVTQTSTGQTINYTYDANGVKLRKQVGSNTRDYINGIEYNNGVIEFIQTEEGRAISGSTYTYDYELDDHLGNTRAMVQQDGSIHQIQDYYPFGMDMNTGNSLNPNPANNYKFNNDEYQIEFNINKYDFGARNYDPVIARWTSVDPIAVFYDEKSPYSYAFSNPIRFGDLDGLGPIDRIYAARHLLMLGSTYKQETDTKLRTGSDAKALLYMDCSEFVCRVMAADGITKGVESHSTGDLLSILSDTKNFNRSMTPHLGDIVIWRGKNPQTGKEEGHTGIVTEVGPGGKIRLIGATGGTRPASENKYVTDPSNYVSSYEDLKGYYSPVVEKPDGKIPAIASVVANRSSKANRAKKTPASKSDPNHHNTENNDRNNPFRITNPFNNENNNMFKNIFKIPDLNLPPINLNFLPLDFTPSVPDGDKVDDEHPYGYDGSHA